MNPRFQVFIINSYSSGEISNQGFYSSLRPQGNNLIRHCERREAILSVIANVVKQSHDLNYKVTDYFVTTVPRNDVVFRHCERSEAILSVIATERKQSFKLELKSHDSNYKVTDYFVVITPRNDVVFRHCDRREAIS